MIGKVFLYIDVSHQYLSFHFNKRSHTTVASSSFICYNAMPSKCSAKNCNLRSGDRGVSRLRFPADDARRALWLKHCPSDFVPKKSSVLCTLHFEPMKQSPRKRSYHQLNRLQYLFPVLKKTFHTGTLNENICHSLLFIFNLIL